MEGYQTQMNLYPNFEDSETLIETGGSAVVSVSNLKVLGDNNQHIVAPVEVVRTVTDD